MGADALVRIAERHNPKRSFLLVSTVLGKHMPVGAARCRLSGLALGLLVAGDPRAEQARRALLDGTDQDTLAWVYAIESTPAGTALPGDHGFGIHGADSPAGEAGDGLAADEPEAFVVIGFAETATALGEQVASALDADWWQTTTRQSAIAERGLRFDESHSHAPDQWIARPAGGWPDGTLVLVDDELTTGSTACNLIEVLHREQPREHYVIAALLDGRGSQTDGPIEATAARLGVTIDVVALAMRPPEDRTQAGWSGGVLPEPAAERSAEARGVREVRLRFDGALQHEGQDRDARLELAGAAVCAASEVGPLPPGSLVLGTGEHLAFAQRSAVLAGGLTSSTTRSPVLVSDRDGYPIRDGLAFANPDDLAVPGFAYNVHPAQRPAIVVHFQDAAHRERGQGLLDALSAAGAQHLTAVTLAP